jgi:putative ABC transport system substrate-binding protein
MLYKVSVAGKLVELLKNESGSCEVGHLFNPDNLKRLVWGSIESVAASMGVVPVNLPVRDAPTIQDAIDRFARDRNGGLVLPVDITTITYRDLIITLAARHRLPAVYSFQADVAGGGLMSYGPDTADLFYRAASYVDRILRGEKAADLPVQAPVKFELAINLSVRLETC